MDDAAVRAVVTRGALIIDEGTIKEYALLYDTDVVWTFGAVTESGIDAVQDGARRRRKAGRIGPGTATRHLVTPLHVEVDGYEAVAHSYFLFLTGTDEVPRPKAFGRYYDVLRLTGDGWRIRSRTVLID